MNYKIPSRCNISHFNIQKLQWVSSHFKIAVSSLPVWSTILATLNFSGTWMQTHHNSLQPQQDKRCTGQSSNAIRKHHIGLLLCNRKIKTCKDLIKTYNLLPNKLKIGLTVIHGQREISATKITRMHHKQAYIHTYIVSYMHARAIINPGCFSSLKPKTISYKRKSILPIHTWANTQPSIKICLQIKMRSHSSKAGGLLL